MAFLSFENIFEMSAYISGTPYGYLRITSNSKIFLAVGPGAILSIINTPKYNCSPTITYFFHYSIAHKTLQQQQSRLSKRTSVKYLSVNKDSSILNTPIPFQAQSSRVPHLQALRYPYNWVPKLLVPKRLLSITECRFTLSYTHLPHTRVQSPISTPRSKYTSTRIQWALWTDEDANAFWHPLNSE